MTYPRAENTIRASGTGKIPIPVYAMLVLTIIGIADAAYVAYGNYAGAQLWCPILHGRNTVINSPYSRVFGTRCRTSALSIICSCLDWHLAAKLLSST
jgi:hypothetical protein